MKVSLYLNGRVFVMMLTGRATRTEHSLTITTRKIKHTNIYVTNQRKAKLKLPFRQHSLGTFTGTYSDCHWSAILCVCGAYWTSVVLESMSSNFRIGRKGRKGVPLSKNVG